MTLTTRTRKLLSFLALATMVVLLGVAPAFAAGDPVASRVDTVITVPLILITLLSGIIIPIAHGLITKARAATAVKVLVGLVLSGVAGLINTATVLDGTAVFSEAAVVAAALAWVVQAAAYLNIYKPLGATQALAPTRGLGPITK